jgi:zinc protease
VASNASLVIVGDFKIEEAKALVERYLGFLPKQAAPERPQDAAPTMASKTVDFTDAVQLPRVYMIWHTPANYAAGDAELQVLASLLSQTKASRLSKALVHDRRIASKVAVSQDGMMLSGMFSVEVTGQTGKTAAEVEAATNEELAKALATPPTAREIEQARNQIESQLWTGVESLRTRAVMLNRYNALIGEPSGIAKDLARFAQITPEAVMAEAKKYLDPQRKLTMRISPKAAAAAAKAGAK